jgi:hypothetical protein
MSQEKVTLTVEELETIESLRKEGFDVVTAIGMLECQLIDMAERKSQLQEGYKQVKAKEIQLLKELTEKYGDGTISLETGEFTKA